MAEDKRRFTHVRYEVEVGLEPESNEIGLDYETLWLKELPADHEPAPRDLFPAPQMESPSLISKSQRGAKIRSQQKAGRE